MIEVMGYSHCLSVFKKEITSNRSGYFICEIAKKHTISSWW